MEWTHSFHGFEALLKLAVSASCLFVDFPSVLQCLCVRTLRCGVSCGQRVMDGIETYILILIFTILLLLVAPQEEVQ